MEFRGQVSKGKNNENEGIASRLTVQAEISEDALRAPILQMRRRKLEC